MSIRFDANGEQLERTTSLPTFTNFSACGFARRNAAGDSYGAVLSLRNSDYSITFGIYARNPANGNQLILYTNDLGDSNIFTMPADGTWFFWGLSCAGTGANQTSGYGRLLGSATLTSVTNGDAAAMTLAALEMGSAMTNLDNFVGDVMCVKMWDAVLTSAEMLRESFQINPVRLQNLHQFSRLESADTAGLRDLSGNGRNWTNVAGGLATNENPPVRLMPRRWKGFRYSSGGPTVFQVVLSDGTALSDELLVTRYRNRHFVDVILAMDQHYLTREFGRYMSDAFAPVIDNQFLHRVFGKTTSDAMFTGDGQNLSRYRNRHFVDPVALTDELLPYRLFFRLLQDTVALTDNFISSAFGGTVYQITLSDAVAVADEILFHRYRNRHFVDTVVAADELLASRYRNRHFVDVVTLADGTVITRERLRHLSETLRITDLELHHLLRVLLASDSVPVTDGTLAFRLRSRDLIDSTVVTDVFTASITGMVVPITIEVRVRLGATSGPRLGQHDPIHLGADAPPILGGYN